MSKLLEVVCTLPFVCTFWVATTLEPAPNIKPLGKRVFCEDCAPGWLMFW
ncbi:Uncharacterised protein [Vibrio cholerae]|nr:Uncharacterised protein [Vibrio cholerae]